MTVQLPDNLKNLTLNDIDSKIRSSVYLQDYEEDPVIEGVKIEQLTTNIGEEGDFGEVMRFNDSGETEKFPGFKLAQFNRTKINGGTIKAWHLHLKQDEIWYITPSDVIFVGLWDTRLATKTKGSTMRIILGGTKRLLFIPRGVAHGSANFSTNPVHIFYLTNSQFTKKNPDELRIPWDTLGSEFWTPKRD